MTEKKNDRSEYHKKYYQRNKEKILARRKQRYEDNPEREKRYMREYRKRQRRDRPPITRKIEIGGVTAFVYTVGEMAKKIDRSVSTVNNWERSGTMPETPFCTEGGYRLYTDGMVSVIREALAHKPRPTKGDEEFYDMVKEGWSTLGIFQVSAI